jgi:rubrerythrin
MDNDAVAVNTKTIRVLEICRDVELANAELYKYFAEIFNSQQELAELWRKTAREEENHALQFVLAINLCGEEMIDSLAVDDSVAKNMLHIVKSLSDEARKNKTSMLDALRTAIKLEENLATFHMTTAVNFVAESHKKLFAAMMKADKNHLADLREFYMRHSNLSQL